MSVLAAGLEGKNRSLAEAWAELSPEQRTAVLSSYTDEEAQKLLYDWSVWARPDQILPPKLEGGMDWFCWALISGRGAGKTRTGSETIRRWVEESPTPIRVALIAESAADARDVMVEGESGILSVSPPWNRPVYMPSKRRLIWPNGSVAIHFSGDKPDQLRGPQFHKAWVDELAKFQYPQEVWDNLELGLRLGNVPQAIVTTTPRPIPLIRELLADPINVVQRVSTYANLANLAPTFIRRVLAKYEGTRLGRQELHAELLSDTPGALWTLALLESSRTSQGRVPDLVRVVVAVDPAESAEEDANEWGIVVCGKGVDRRGYVLEDASDNLTPNEAMKRVISLYRKYGAARVVAETNKGGAMIEALLRTVDDRVSYRGVHASRSKQARAEPIAALMEQGKIKHVGQFARMEDQMMITTPDGYTGSGSPDRMDAMVWGMSDLMLGAHTSADPKAYTTYKR